MKYFLIISFCFFCLNTDAQQAPLSYSRVKIDLSDTHVSEIARLGLEADHGVYVKGKHLINDFSGKRN